MMKLLYKEIRLCAHPTSLVFAFLGCLVLVPAYPYSVILLFGSLAPYTAILPVSKAESVGGKCLLVVSLQLFQLLFSVPFAMLRQGLHIANNPVGLDATPAWYGLGLLVYGVYDVLFLASFYKSGYKAGRAFLLASIPLGSMMVLVEATAHIPALSWMDSVQPEDLLRQLPILLAGIIGYAALLFLAYRISAKRYEKVDL